MVRAQPFILNLDNNRGSIMAIIDKSSLEVILLIEDEEDHARIIKKALKARGRLMNNIYWVKDGEEAMEYMLRRGRYNEENAPKPGLILLDIKLPMKNGFDVLQELKSDEILKVIPIVMLTTTSNSEDIQRALKLGANDYIVKPIKFSDFVEKVGNLGFYWGFISDSRAEI